MESTCLRYRSLLRAQSDSMKIIIIIKKKTHFTISIFIIDTEIRDSTIIQSCFKLSSTSKLYTSVRIFK